MDENDFLSGRTPEQDAASDDVEPDPAAGVRTGEGPESPEEPAPAPERAREGQAGL